MEGMTFALHLGDVTCKELNLSEGPAAVIVGSTEHKKRLDGWAQQRFLCVPEL